MLMYSIKSSAKQLNLEPISQIWIETGNKLTLIYVKRKLWTNEKKICKKNMKSIFALHTLGEVYFCKGYTNEKKVHAVRFFFSFRTKCDNKMNSEGQFVYLFILL